MLLPDVGWSRTGIQTLSPLLGSSIRDFTQKLLQGDLKMVKNRNNKIIHHTSVKRSQGEGDFLVGYGFGLSAPAIV